MNTSTRRDGEFYDDWQVVIFLVENVLFKVPMIRFIQESEVFKSMFSLPQSSSVPVEGLTDDHPIHLDGVKEEDFRQLLKLLYPRVAVAPLFLNEDGWVSVLELSTKWDMERVRKLALDSLNASPPQNPCKLLVLGHRFSMKSWIFCGADALVRRDAPLGMDDVKMIGIEEALKIAAIRECFCGGRPFTRRGSVIRRQDVEEQVKIEYDLVTVRELNTRLIRDPGPLRWSNFDI